MGTYLFMIITPLILFSCLAGTPIMNNAISMNENDSKITVSSGIGKLFLDDKNEYSLLFTKKGKSSYAPVFYVSFQEKINDIFSLDYYTFGLRLKEDFYNKYNLHISLFQSLYLFGTNIGFIISYFYKDISFYTSLRNELNIVEIPIEGEGGSGRYLNLIPTLGINLKLNDYYIYLELIASLPISTIKKRAISKEDDSGFFIYKGYAVDSVYTERFYSLQLGMSF